MATIAPEVDVLLVVDMQNSFCHPKGAMYDVLGAPLYDIARVVDANAAVVSAARTAGIPVVFTRQQYYRGFADFGPLFPHGPLLNDRSVEAPKRKNSTRAGCLLLPVGPELIDPPKGPIAFTPWDQGPVPR
ncbi:isochorismatase family protein [Streptosporangium sp. NBC_01755]|uniref:isochorismatase family protein n=1 Tax=unclassified Streptosporangium TaxID=2632669 RepID=UPI002DDA50AA|nr:MULTISPECIES: isochorismatase family protein [unclassified Streptosporangium]WSA24642.1 isochorismatase family protein [Streptosporangium sp. NBC_01810]WSC97282.1 isochorismatase family protein [Streptosporangium sp. NBC_01755]